MYIALFGTLQIQANDQDMIHIEPRRAAELLGYLLLYRDHLQEREKLATLLWPDAPSDHAKRYLRQTLWQLQSKLNHCTASDSHLLAVDYERIGINPQANYWLDVAVFEQTFAAVEGKAGKTFCEQQAAQVRAAVQLYKGELLEGWYQDWCIYERERFQNMYMALLDKLLTYSEAHAEYEAGMAYGVQILRYDRAREQTHRHLMRLHYLAGNRTAAIHQYEICVAALHDELNVTPSKSTVALYRQICAERDPHTVPTAETPPPPHSSATSQPTDADAIVQVEKIQTTIAHLQNQIAQLMHNLQQSSNLLM